MQEVFPFQNQENTIHLKEKLPQHSLIVCLLHPKNNLSYLYYLHLSRLENTN